MKTYFDEYRALLDKYKVAFSRTQIALQSRSEEEFDVIVEPCGTGYAHNKFRVIKNRVGLSTKDLAILCDGGNLCFGYRAEGNIICIYTD